MEKVAYNNKVIVHLVGSTYGGVAAVAMTLMRGQINRGNIVFAVIYEDGEDLRKTLDSRINIIRVPHKKFPGANMLFGFGISKIYKIVNQQYPNAAILIHAHNVATVGLFANIKNKALVCTLHGICVRGTITIHDRISESINSLILNKLQRNCKSIIAVSKATLTHYQRFLNKGKIEVVYNGVKTSDINTIHKESKNNVFVVGHVGGVSKSKGWDTALDAYSLFAKSIKNATEFVSAGNISFEKEELDGMLRNCEVANSVKLLGLVPDAGNSVIPNINVLLLPSMGEGLPMSILESLGHGIPVIATDVGGIKEAVQDGYNGFIVAKDVEQISQRLLVLYKDKETYQQMCCNAIKSYNERFMAEKMLDSYISVYKRQFNAIFKIDM